MRELKTKYGPINSTNETSHFLPNMDYFKVFYIFVILIVLVLVDIHVTDARRGGGGFRSGSRSGTRSGTRGGSSSVRSTTRFASRRTYYGPSYSQGSWKTAAAIGTLYGLSSYTRRRRYYDSPNSDPTVCFNEKNLRNGTYGYFICPEEGQDDDMAYCCGDEDEQRCCTYTDATAVGRIIGIVIGVLAFCTVLGIIVYCFCIKQRCTNRSSAPPMTFSGLQTAGNPTYAAGQTATTQYAQKQEPYGDPPSYDSQVYNTIDSNHYSNPAPIGFEDEKQIPSGNVISAAPPPYPTAPDPGNQGAQTPSGFSNHI